MQKTMILYNESGEKVFEVIKKKDDIKILFYKPKDMKDTEWEGHIVPFQKFMSSLKIKARRKT